MSNNQTLMQILAQAIRKQYPDTDYAKLKTMLREMLFAPTGRVVKVDNKMRLEAEDLRFMTANALEKADQKVNIKFVNKTETIETLIDPMTEYFNWLSETTSILNHLNDGFVSQEDAIERETFLALLEKRQAELMVCLALYESCASDEAKERAQFTCYKLKKLREMNAAIQFLTRQGQNIETTRSEYDAAIPYYKYFKNLQKLPFGYDMPYEQKIKLGISHDDDEDLAENYNHYAIILNEMLDEMQREDDELNQIRQTD
ncbi:MAG: hypothetical protein IJ870_00645 [Alphaproteobacteria bacterium]|nr:hypothetical protein [Alphaproteobacteria bacterium]